MVAYYWTKVANGVEVSPFCSVGKVDAETTYELLHQCELGSEEGVGEP